MSDDPSQRGEGGGRGKKKPVRRPESYLPEMLRSLPQSLDAEKGVLGSILLSPTTVLDECITRQVGPKYFHLPAHALIFSALVEMQEKKKPIDLISLTQFLEDSHRLAGVGGAMAVTDLFTFVPTATNASYYLEIVREKYLLRQIIATCTEYWAAPGGAPHPLPTGGQAMTTKATPLTKIQSITAQAVEDSVCKRVFDLCVLFLALLANALDPIWPGGMDYVKINVILFCILLPIILVGSLALNVILLCR